MARIKKNCFIKCNKYRKIISVTCNKSGIREYLKKKNQLKY